MSKNVTGFGFPTDNLGDASNVYNLIFTSTETIAALWGAVSSIKRIVHYLPKINRKEFFAKFRFPQVTPAFTSVLAGAAAKDSGLVDSETAALIALTTFTAFNMMQTLTMACKKNPPSAREKRRDKSASRNSRNSQTREEVRDKWMIQPSPKKGHSAPLLEKQDNLEAKNGSKYACFARCKIGWMLCIGGATGSIVFLIFGQDLPRTVIFSEMSVIVTDLVATGMFSCSVKCGPKEIEAKADLERGSTYIVNP
jgi:hypothetical protein